VPYDRLLFIRVYLKQNPTKLLHGRLFGIRQSKATQWVHILLPALCNSLCALDDTLNGDVLERQPARD
jgi:hypothetical protein